MVKYLGGVTRNYQKDAVISLATRTLESFFTKSLDKFPYFHDAESTAEAEGHLKKFKHEVDERPLVDGLVGSAEEGKHEEDVEDSYGGREDEELTGKLHEALAARDEDVKELEEKCAEKDS